MRNASDSYREKEVVLATSFSLWRRVLGWFVCAIWFVPFFPLGAHRLGPLFDSAVLFRVIAGVSTLACLIVVVETGWHLRRSVLTGVAGAWLVVVALSTVFSVDAYRSVFGEMVRNEGVLHGALAVGFTVTLSFLLRDQGLFRRFCVVGVHVACLVGVLATVVPWLAHLLGGAVPSERAWGFYVNPIFFGMNMGMSAGLAFWLAQGARGWRRVWYGGAAVLLLYFALASGSRGVILSGLVVTMLTMLRMVFGYLRTRGWSRRRAGGVLAAVLIVGAIGVSFLSPKNTPFHRLHDLSFAREERVVVWRMFVPAIADRWLFGWGPENQLAAFYAHFNPQLLANTTAVFDRSHNMVLDTLATVGLAGLTVLGAWYVLLWRALGRRARAEGNAASAWWLQGGLLFYLLANLFAFDSLFVWLPLIAMSAYGFSGEWVPGVGTPRRIRNTVVVGSGAAVVGAVLICSAFLPTWAVLVGERAALFGQADVEGSARRFADIRSWRSYPNPQLAKISAGAVRRAMQFGDRSDLAVLGRAAAIAEQGLAQERRQHPWDPTYGLAEARLLHQWGKYAPEVHERLVALLEQHIARFPTRTEARGLFALFSLQQGDIKKARLLIDESIAVNPHVGDTYLLKAFIEAAAGDRQAAEREAGVGIVLDPNLWAKGLRVLAAVRSVSSSSLYLYAGGVVESGDVPTE